MRAAVLLAGVTVCGAAAIAAAMVGPRPPGPVALAGGPAAIAIPAAARAALARQAGAAPLGAVESEMLDGVAVYSAEWTAGGMTGEVTVTAAGDMVELEESVAPEAVPAAVRQAAEARLGAGSRIRYERVTLVLYEAEAENGGKDGEVMLSATGRVQAGEQADDEEANLQDDNDDDGADEADDEDDENDDLDDDDGEEEISLLDVPKKAIKAARGAVKGISLMEAEKRTTDEGVLFILSGDAGDIEYEIVVTAKGKVLEVAKDD